MSPVDARIVRPDLPSLTQVLPAEPLLLMGAGPVPVPAEVATAGSMVINHLGHTMDMVIRHVKEMARYAFQTSSEHIFGVSGPASAAMEMSMGNLLWPGRRVLVLKTGWFSGRFAEMAEGVGADVDIFEVAEGTPIDASMVRKKLRQASYDVVTLVQGETSCGVWTVDLPQIIQLIRENGALSVVDAVCTLSTMPFKTDEWGVDVVFTGSQKGLSSLPGVALISFSEDAWKVVQGRKHPKPHWCLDVLRAEDFWERKKYHYTAPVPALLALHEALRLICDETLEQRFKRHRESSLALQAGIEGMGLTLSAAEGFRLNSVVAIDIPKGVDGNRVRDYMSRMFKVEISGAFGLEIVRIGQMGEQCRAPNLFRVLHALGVAVAKEGFDVDQSVGMAARENRLAKHAEEIL